MTNEKQAELETFVTDFVDAEVGLECARPSVIRKGAYVRVDVIFSKEATKEDRTKRVNCEADKQEWKDMAASLIGELCLNDFGEYVLSSASGIHFELVSCAYQEGREP